MSGFPVHQGPDAARLVPFDRQRVRRQPPFPTILQCRTSPDCSSRIVSSEKLFMLSDYRRRAKLHSSLLPKTRLPMASYVYRRLELGALRKRFISQSRKANRHELEYAKHVSFLIYPRGAKSAHGESAAYQCEATFQDAVVETGYCLTNGRRRRAIPHLLTLGRRLEPRAH